ncbi:MAG TPA: hypothetical protein VN316_00615 [candidate division Zixibacteria bacterium]|nr:hypothetical protein [candidate division Zixibacteria bacterium]
MDPDKFPPGFLDVLEFPLFEALYRRRARRFLLGASIPDGPLAFASLDLEFYDYHFKAGAYLQTQARRMARWHPDKEK